MAGCRIDPLEEVSQVDERGWTLCFQYCLYKYDDGGRFKGYRFIWRKKNGKLQAARGQACIPSIATAKMLMDMACKKGWGNFNGDETEKAESE